MPLRYSRHYYDLALMAQSPIKEDALADLKLLNEVVAFKQQFYPSAWARYNLAQPGSLQPIPATRRIAELENDFERMQEMNFAKQLNMSDILKTLTALQDEINQLGTA